jgi:hypothetical protein
MGQKLPDDDLHGAILSRLAGRRKGSVVSTNAVVDDVESSFHPQKTESELARLVSEAAMLLGLVPVYDPAKPRGSGFARRSYLQPARMAAEARY